MPELRTEFGYNMINKLVVRLNMSSNKNLFLEDVSISNLDYIPTEIIQMFEESTKDNDINFTDRLNSLVSTKPIITRKPNALFDRFKQSV